MLKRLKKLFTKKKQHYRFAFCDGKKICGGRNQTTCKKCKIAVRVYKDHKFIGYLPSGTFLEFPIIKDVFK